MKDVFIFNSLTNKVEKFVPLHKNEVSIYVCGPTVYNDAHIGNIRPVVFFDSVVRFLSYLGYKVTYVSNYTDVDDKIIDKAQKEKISEGELAKKMIAKYEELLSSLNCLKTTIHPKATEYIQKMIGYISTLVDKGYAYESEGDVFFRVKNVEEYGKLSNKNINDLKVGARIVENEKKEFPLDFALWKKTSEGIAWDSPWSKGRPGWHTECAAMINSIFGPTIDIHGGGFDLKFPHHENEIAQAKAHNDSPLAKYWIHNGFVDFGEEKMSKSLGNVVLAKDAIKDYGGDAVRYLLISTSYRSPLSFNEKIIKNAKNEVDKILSTYKKAAIQLQLKCGKIVKDQKTEMDSFLSSLCSDFGFANAITSLNEVVKETNTLLRSNPINLNRLEMIFLTLMDMLDILGLNTSFPILSKDDIALYKEYETYKAKAEYQKSDELRKKLIEKGIM